MQPELPFQSHSRTSRIAARSVKPHAHALHRKVLTAIVAAMETGLTDNEGIIVTGLGGSTYRPRRIELFEAQLIYRSDATRLTTSNRPAAVWLAVPDALDLLTESLLRLRSAA